MTVATATLTKVPNYVNGQWIDSKATEWLDVTNPATGEVIAQTPLSSAAEVAAAIEAAAAAFPEWRRTPAEDRIQPLFKLKHILEEQIDDLARILTTENGKTFTEAKAELRRAIENVEVACGIPTMMQGYNLEDVARGIDEMMIRQPLGVVAAIVPFNFPGMIPFWFLPYAIATGNTFVLKPSERVPLTMKRAFELMENIGLPKGVVNLVNGGKNAVNALLDHPKVRAISFVGSTPVARYVYARAGEHGKRAQCQGGAKNHVIVLPDADMKMTTQIIGDSAFGCAGQRCLAVSVAVTVGEAQKTFRDSITEAAASLRVGNGLDEGVQMGPVITPQSKSRVESLIATGEKQGAKILLDGRNSRDSERRSRKLREADRSRRGSRHQRTDRNRNLRSGAEPGPRQRYGRGAGLPRTQPVRQSGIAVHFERGCGTAFPLRSAGRQHRHQHRRGRAHGVLSLQRMERQLLRHHARPGTRRHRVLYRKENRGRALGERPFAKILEPPQAT